MVKSSVIRVLLGSVALLAVSACAPTTSEFVVSGYDAQGSRTGTVIPSAMTLTPY